jgi:methyl-accepting chemotaxis protein
MKQGILHRARTIFVILCVLTLVGLGIIIILNATGSEINSVAQLKQMQSYRSLSSGLSVLQDASVESFFVLAAKTSAEQKQLAVNEQKFLNSFNRALDNSFLAYPTSEKQKMLEDFKDRFSVCQLSVRRAVESNSADPAFFQKIRENERRLASDLVDLIAAEHQELDKSLQFVQSRFVGIQTVSVVFALILLLAFIISYVAFFHTPIKQELATCERYVQLLRSMDRTESPLRLDSKSEYVWIMNMLGETFHSLRLVLFKAHEVGLQGRTTLDEIQQTLSNVEKVADAEDKRYQEIRVALEQMFGDMDESGAKVSKISQMIAETSHTMSSIRSDIDSLRQGITAISTSADENLHTVAGIDRQTTEISDNTTKIRKSIEQISNKTKQMVENAKEREELLQQMKDQLDSQAEAAQKVKDVDDEHAKQSGGHRQEVVDTRDQASAACSDLEAINGFMQLVEAKTVELEGKIKHIDEVMEKVSEISRKTNILALNAQVEAAKAKEGGEGFKVIADEIKSLAGTASDSTSAIGGIFDEIQASLKEVKQTVHEAKEKGSAGMIQSKKTVESLGKILVGMDTRGKQRVEVKPFSEKANKINVAVFELVQKIMSKSATVTTSLDEQLKESERMTAEVKELDDITTSVSEQTADVKKVIEQHIVQSIKKISADTVKVGEAIAEQDAATTDAESAVKEIKGNHEAISKQQKAHSKMHEILVKLFEDQSKGLVQLNYALREIRKTSDSQIAIFALPDREPSTNSLVRFHEKSA